MSRLRIGLDCDGVLYNFDQYVRDQIAARLDIHIHEAYVSHWHAISNYSPEVRRCFEAVMSEEPCWYAGNPYAGALESTQRLAAVSDVYVVTHVPPQFMDARVRWLQVNGFPVKDVIVGRDKWRSVQQLALDTLIDDNFDNCDDVARNCYTPAFLVERPWNAGMPLHELVTRGPLELAVERIEKLASQVYQGDLVA
jgi:5'(3')-deoxyribonucleotidase